MSFDWADRVEDELSRRRDTFVLNFGKQVDEAHDASTLISLLSQLHASLYVVPPGFYWIDASPNRYICAEDVWEGRQWLYLLDPSGVLRATFDKTANVEAADSSSRIAIIHRVKAASDAEADEALSEYVNDLFDEFDEVQERTRDHNDAVTKVCEGLIDYIRNKLHLIAEDSALQ